MKDKIVTKDIENLRAISKIANEIKISFDKTELIFIFESQNINFQKIESMFNSLHIIHYFQYDKGKYYYGINTSDCPNEILKEVQK